MKKRRTVYRTYRYTVGNRILIVERANTKTWEAWYENDCSAIWVAKSRKEVINDACTQEAIPCF